METDLIHPNKNSTLTKQYFHFFLLSIIHISLLRLWGLRGWYGL
jgi:hypothetical protein